MSKAFLTAGLDPKVCLVGAFPMRDCTLTQAYSHVTGPSHEYSKASIALISALVTGLVIYICPNKLHRRFILSLLTDLLDFSPRVRNARSIWLGEWFLRNRIRIHQNTRRSGRHRPLADAQPTSFFGPKRTRSLVCFQLQIDPVLSGAYKICGDSNHPVECCPDLDICLLAIAIMR